MASTFVVSRVWLGSVLKRAFIHSGVTKLLAIIMPRASVATITILVVADNPPKKAMIESAVFSAKRGRAST